MSVLGFGYVVNNKARVAIERALRNPQERVLGVEWELILTSGFMAQRMGVGERTAQAERRSRQTNLGGNLDNPDRRVRSCAGHKVRFFSDFALSGQFTPKRNSAVPSNEVYLAACEICPYGHEGKEEP
jgi:hypothetical protein